MNAATRVIMNLSLRDHVKSALKQLHWLPVEQRITYKLCLFMHHIHTGQAKHHSTCQTVYRQFLHSDSVGGAALWQPRFACFVRISVYEHVCRRRTSLNLRQADSLVLSVCVGALGIDFRGVVTVFIDVLARFPCWLVQQWRPPCWKGLSARPAMRDDSSYSRNQLVNLRQYAPRLDDVTRPRY